MTNVFPKTDLARILALPLRARLLGLLAALRFLGLPELVRVAGLDATGLLAELVEEKLALRFERTLDAIAGVREPVFALRRAGAAAVARALDVEPATVVSERPSSVKKSMLFLDHTLARNRFALLLAQALAGPAPAALLSWEHDADRLADAAHPVENGRLRRVPLVGDGLAILRGPRGIEGLLVEIDRGTERPWYLGRKYAAYETWWRDGGPRRRFDLPALRILTVAPDLRRTDLLRRTAADATGGRAGGLYWFASEEALLSQGIVAPIWRTLRSDNSIPLWI